MQNVTNRATHEAIARKVGVTAPSVTRWKAGSPKPRTAAAFARAYNRPVLEAFVAAGYLTAEEAGERPAGQVSLHDIPESELIEEVARRARLREKLLAGRAQPAGTPAGREMEEDFLVRLQADLDSPYAKRLQLPGVKWRVGEIEDPDTGKVYEGFIFDMTGVEGWSPDNEGGSDAGNTRQKNGGPDEGPTKPTLIHGHEPRDVSQDTPPDNWQQLAAGAGRNDPAQNAAENQDRDAEQGNRDEEPEGE